MIIGVGVLLSRPDGRVLLGRRTYDREPENWCLPGGKVDAGESFEAAARRETLEECGFDIGTPPPPFALLLTTWRAAPCVTAAFHLHVPTEAQARVMEPSKLPE